MGVGIEVLVLVVDEYYGVERTLADLVAVLDIIQLDRVGADTHMHQVVQIEDGAVGVRCHLSHSRARHRLEDVGQHSISGQLAVRRFLAKQVRHVDERTATRAAAYGEYHVDFGIGAQQLVLVVGLDARIRDLVDYAAHLLCHLHVVDREGKTPVGTYLTCAQRHTGQGIEVLFRYPGEVLLVHIIDRSGILHQYGQLLVRTQGHLFAVNGQQRFLVRATVRIDA